MERSDGRVHPIEGLHHHAAEDPCELVRNLRHEHNHYTGHKSRLDRDLKSCFDKEAYVFEEWVAEIGAAMTCATLC
jgi:antirestriction protein ArdC